MVGRPGVILAPPRIQPSKGHVERWSFTDLPSFVLTHRCRDEPAGGFTSEEVHLDLLSAGFTHMCVDPINHLRRGAIFNSSRESRRTASVSSLTTTRLPVPHCEKDFYSLYDGPDGRGKGCFVQWSIVDESFSRVERL